MITKLEGFNYKEGVIAGDKVFLVTPEHIGVKWNDENKRFRSAIIRQDDGKIISSGFRKFTNFSETPSFEPWNPEWKFSAIKKMDGSLWCINKYKGELIVRTRGTFDVSVHDTGNELSFLKEKYPKIFNNEIIDTEEVTILCEHTTPARIIVIREHVEPTLTLIGCIRNSDGRYFSQMELDGMASRWNVGRPATYNFSSVSECIDNVKLWKGAEGVVLYSPDGQTLKKIKADEYLALHKMKSSVSSLSSLIDVFVESKTATYDKFYQYISTMLDHEIAEFVKNDILKITNSYEIYKNEYELVKEFIPSLVGMTRKDQALTIIGKWKDWRKSLAFTLLDKKNDELKVADILTGYIKK